MNAYIDREIISQLKHKNKFQKDLFWNICSLVILAISGVALNVVVGKFYGAEALGVFNLVYAVYMLSSQFAVGGIHLSVLKYISQFNKEKEISDRIISSAIYITSIASMSVATVIFLLRPWIGVVLKNSEIEISLLYILPGLIFFALNKVLFSVLNGYRFMKIFAFMQSARYILLILFLIAVILMNGTIYVMPVIFSVTEFVLFIMSIIYVLRIFTPVSPKKWDGWERKHISFGFKSFSSGAFNEINSRVDVLILGILTNERSVGIYSFAAVFVEGFYQLIVVVRNNINPILTRYYYNHEIDLLKIMIKRGILITYVLMAGLGTLALIIYPLFVNILLPGSEFVNSWPVFTISMMGVILSSGYLLFNMLPIQIGYPIFYSKMILLMVLINIVLNLILIPLFGIYGSAIATSAAMFSNVICLKVFMRKKLQLKI